jgi:MFS family permease
LLPILNAASIAGRIVPNIIADKVGPLNVLVPASLFTGILAFGWIGITSLPGILVFAILYGFCSGCYVSLPPVAIVTLSPDMRKLGTRYVCLPNRVYCDTTTPLDLTSKIWLKTRYNLPIISNRTLGWVAEAYVFFHRMGQSFFTSAFGLLVGAPVSGAILSRTGSYLGLQLFSGCSIVLAGILLIFARVNKVGSELWIRA